jgi:hypothetical protein
MSNLWLIDVAQSITKGKGSLVGTPNVRGLVPMQGCTPNVGAIDGRALVPVKPIKLCTNMLRNRQNCKHQLFAHLCTLALLPWSDNTRVINLPKCFHEPHRVVASDTILQIPLLQCGGR